uniref:Secreted protein n=1 Tax=Parastrongyloides trichosuri TaxID=131310 RepID=A0A0N4ZQ09_PARTI
MKLTIFLITFAVSTTFGRALLSNEKYQNAELSRSKRHLFSNPKDLMKQVTPKDNIHGIPFSNKPLKGESNLVKKAANGNYQKPLKGTIKEVKK